MRYNDNIMSNCNPYQHNHWYPLVANYQHGEYCRGCGKSHTWKNFTGLVLDKINNDGNHTIKDNLVTDFQLLCKSCNKIKNPSRRPVDLEQTQSEHTNQRAEKPLFEWLMHMLNEGKEVKYSYFVSEGSFRFDISPETIERRYYKKYLSPEAESSPFGLWTNHFDVTFIILKYRDNPKVNLDISLRNAPDEYKTS